MAYNSVIMIPGFADAGSDHPLIIHIARASATVTWKARQRRRDSAQSFNDYHGVVALQVMRYAMHIPVQPDHKILSPHFSACCFTYENASNPPNTSNCGAGVGQQAVEKKLKKPNQSEPHNLPVHQMGRGDYSCGPRPWWSCTMQRLKGR
jgi:hypothetical protein